jgi:hypothetical protein
MKTMVFMINPSVFKVKSPFPFVSPIVFPSYSYHIPTSNYHTVDDELYSPTMMKEKNNILKLTICIPITFEYMI